VQKSGFGALDAAGFVELPGPMSPPPPYDVRHLRGLRVAILARRLPARAHDGAAEYLLAVVRALAEQGATLEILYAEGLLEGARPWVDVDTELDGLAVVRVQGAVALGQRRLRVRMRASDVASSLRKWTFERLGETGARETGVVRELRKRLDLAGTYSRPPTQRELVYFGCEISRFRPDVVIADTAFLAPVFDYAPFCEVPVRAVLTHDVMFERAASMDSAGVASSLVGWTRAAELAALRNANTVIAIQSADARTFAALLGTERVVELPMPIAPKPTSAATVPGRMLFVGSDGEANVSGLRFFVNEVLPLVRAEYPDATLEVCGSVAKRIDAVEGVLRTGWVADLAPHYAAARLVVVPLTVGSGLKIKLTEALAYGRAVVSTGVGLQGVVEHGDPPFGLRADGTAELAAACLRLLADDEQRAQAERQALRWVEERYAPQVVVAPLVARIHDLLRA
jgi:hypothetical protein